MGNETPEQAIGNDSAPTFRTLKPGVKWGIVGVIALRVAVVAAIVLAIWDFVQQAQSFTIWWNNDATSVQQGLILGTALVCAVGIILGVIACLCGASTRTRVICFLFPFWIIVLIVFISRRKAVSSMNYTPRRF